MRSRFLLALLSAIASMQLYSGIVFAVTDTALGEQASKPQGCTCTGTLTASSGDLAFAKLAGYDAAAFCTQAKGTFSAGSCSNLKVVIEAADAAACTATTAKTLAENYGVPSFVQEKVTVTGSCSWGDVAETTPTKTQHVQYVAAQAQQAQVQTEQSKLPPKPIKPRLQIEIPNLSFTDPEDLALVENAGGQQFVIPYIGQYINGVFDYAIGVLAFIAVMSIVVAGFIWATAGGNASRIDTAKDTMSRAVIGLGILLGSYTILYIIDPSLTNLNPVNLNAVETESFEMIQYEKYGSEPADPATKPPGDTSTVGVESKPGTKLLSGTTPGETLRGRCHIVNINSFPKFDITAFSDGSNGSCLLQEFAPTIGQSTAFEGQYLANTTFLGRSVKVHKLAAASLQKVEAEIRANASPIVAKWIASFTSQGAYVQYADPMTKLYAQCDKPGAQTWVVTSASGNTKARLFTRILKNLHGNHSDVLRGDLHSLGLAIDVYAPHNPDHRPIMTNIPVQVVDAFRKNGWSWLGATDRRDAMHFQYFGSKCFKGLGTAYPTGTGCCINQWPTLSKPTSKFAGCMAAGGVATSYQECMGPSAKAGNAWVAQNP